MKVNFDMDSLQNCQCGACLVHDGSQCVVQRTEGMKFHWSPEPTPRDVEGIYCAQQVGRSQCQDLAVKKACLCPTCAVWRGHDLETNYFCVNGSAS